MNDIQNIMKKNIQEVLDRGEKLESESCPAWYSVFHLHRQFPFPHYYTHTRARARTIAHADVSKISNRLVSESKRFKWGAKRLNVLDAWRRWFPCIIAALIIAAVLLWYFMFSR